MPCAWCSAVLAWRLRPYLSARERTTRANSAPAAADDLETTRGAAGLPLGVIGFFLGILAGWLAQ